MNSETIALQLRAEILTRISDLLKEEVIDTRSERNHLPDHSVHLDEANRRVTEAELVAREFLEAASAATQPLPMARFLDDHTLVCGHDGCEAIANRMCEDGLTRYWTIEVRSQGYGGAGLYADSGPCGLDTTDDGDGNYYLECTNGHRNERPFSDWNWD